MVIRNPNGRMMTGQVVILEVGVTEQLQMLRRIKFRAKSHSQYFEHTNTIEIARKASRLTNSKHPSYIFALPNRTG